MTLFLWASFLSVLFLANLDGALPENTAAPGDLTCGRAPCHNIPVNVGTAQVSILFHQGDSTYRADSIYELTVKIQDPMTARNGFQMLALNASNQNTGTWLLTEPAKMKIIPGISFPARRYVTHKAAGNQQNEWKLRWRAPSANAGKVTFYASVLSANNNGLNTGDAVYSTKRSVVYAATLAAGETLLADYKIYPIPATTGIWIEATDQAIRPSQFSLYDLSGLRVKISQAAQTGTSFLETLDLPGGVYFLTIHSGKGQLVKKIVIQ